MVQEKKTLIFSNDHSSVCGKDMFTGADGAIPIFDYSQLISSDHTVRSQGIEILGTLCSDYGFFIVTNHGVPQRAMNGVIEKLLEYFDLPEEEKQKYDTKCPNDRIRSGKGNQNLVSREFVKMAVHPSFHCPHNPPGLSESLQEYSEKVREVGIELLRGISGALGLEEKYIEKKLELELGYDFFTANNYPPRQTSENRIGQLPHIDPGLLIFIIENVSGGLQVEHKGKWLNVNLKPGWIFVNVADHLEILTNGKYKSAIHRVVVNNEARRVTLPLFMGPSLHTAVSPAQELTDKHNPPAFRCITYKEYLEFDQFHVIDGKSCLHQIRL